MFRWRRYCWWCRSCFCCATVLVTSSASTCSPCRTWTPTTSQDIRFSLPKTCSNICSTPTSPPTFSCTMRPGGRSAVLWCAAVDTASDGWRQAAVSTVSRRSVVRTPPGTVQRRWQICRWEGLHRLLTITDASASTDCLYCDCAVTVPIKCSHCFLSWP